MFSFGRRDDDISPTHQVLKLNLSLSTPKGGKAGKGFHQKSNGRGRNNFQGNGRRNNHPRLHRMNVHDTSDGVEVSLDYAKGGGPASPLEAREPPQVPYRPEPVMSMERQLRQRQRVHRSQFSLNFPVHPQSNSNFAWGANINMPSQLAHQKQLQNLWRQKDHRIPLRGIVPAEPAYEDVLNLLQHSLVSDERTAVQQELELMNLEIEALQQDKEYIQSQCNLQSISPTAARSPQSQSFFSTNSTLSSSGWNVQDLLDSARLTDSDRRQLESLRGNCVTLCISNPKSKETLLNICGAVMPQVLKSHAGKQKGRLPPGDALTLGPHNCKPGGAASSIRQICLLKDTAPHNSSGKRGAVPSTQQSGIFVSRDTGKAQVWGRIPPKLFRRMQANGSASQCTMGDLVYLSTGPLGCYFAEFRSGETWWGSAVEDDLDFHAVLKSWDVYKVVFGPTAIAEDSERSATYVLNSWIILGKDGRAAWKNIPRRLHQRLESRLGSWAAISSVSLGPGDSYFCRFLDGSIDYCVSASVAAACDYIERNGGTVTDIALHPEISNDFLIRHRELR